MRNIFLLFFLIHSNLGFSATESKEEDSYTNLSDDIIGIITDSLDIISMKEVRLLNKETSNVISGKTRFRITLESIETWRKRAALYTSILWDLNELPTEEDLRGLTDLIFGFGFNQVIPAGVLPSSLTHLKFRGHT